MGAVGNEGNEGNGTARSSLREKVVALLAELETNPPEG